MPLRSPRIGRRGFLVLGALGVLPACGRTSGDGGGGRRVVSLSPSTTEAAFAIGAGGLIVARSRHCDHPPEALALPAVGGYADPSLEAIFALRPTLAVGARGPAGVALEEALRARGIDAFFPETESLAQIEAMILALGERLGAAEGAARVAGAMRREIEAVERGVARALSGRERPRAVFVFDVAPIVVAGPGSFPDELLRRAGAEPAVQRGGNYPTISLEHLLALDPDVVLDGTEGGGAGGGVLGVRERPGWRELRALREGRARPLRSSAALRPGPRIAEGLGEIAALIHGPAFRPAGAR